jgi:hypothetical protein
METSAFDAADGRKLRYIVPSNADLSMTHYPIADTPLKAAAPDAPTARTASEAAQKAGAAVYLAVEALPLDFDSLAAAEAHEPRLYGDGRFSLEFVNGAWRIFVRFFRTAPAMPVARTALAASEKPLGFARTPDEAMALLGAPAERVSEPAPKIYKSFSRARARYGALITAGQGELAMRENGFSLVITYWRPIRATPVTPVERAEIAVRAAAPMRGPPGQDHPFIGLFESLAPENPAIVLAEEGDGRPGV